MGEAFLKRAQCFIRCQNTVVGTHGQENRTVKRFCRKMVLRIRNGSVIKF